MILINSQLCSKRQAMSVRVMLERPSARTSYRELFAIQIPIKPKLPLKNTFRYKYHNRIRFRYSLEVTTRVDWSVSH